MNGEPPDESPWLIDFFEEGETHENVPNETVAPPPAGREPAAHRIQRGPSVAGRARVRRLGLLVVVFLAAATGIIIALGGQSEAGSDTAYLDKLAVPAQDSQNVGAALTTLLTSTPSSSSALVKSLHDLLVRQQQALEQTLAISPPPRLRVEQQQAVSAMQFRVGGLSGLVEGFSEAVAHSSEADWPAQLSEQADGLITSDVIWHDFFVTPANAQVASDGDRGAVAPASTFVTNADITAPEAMETVLGDLAGQHSTTTSSSSVLQLGDSGPAVSAWQTELNVWIGHQTGLSKLAVSGTFDQATQQATMSFQTAAAISVDGIVGPQTRAALDAATAKSG